MQHIFPLFIVFSLAFGSFLSAMVLAPLFFRVLASLGLFQTRTAIDPHKIRIDKFFSPHGLHVPLGFGGLFVLIPAFLVLFLWLGFGEQIVNVVFGQNVWEKMSGSVRGQLYLPLFAIFAGALLGSVDDFFQIRFRRGLARRIKFLAELALAFGGGWWFHFRLGWSEIHIPMIGDADIGLWYLPLFALVVFVTVESVASVDEQDGLAGWSLLFAFAAFGILAYVKGFDLIAVLSASLIGGLAAFLWWNVFPARIILGHVGSLSLGAGLAVIAFLTDSLAVLPIVGVLFYLQFFSNILQFLARKLFAVKVFVVAPLTAHLQQNGWSNEQIVERARIFGAIFTVVGIILGMLGAGERFIV